MEREDFTKWRLDIIANPNFRASEGEKGIPFPAGRDGETIMINKAGYEEIKRWRAAFMAWRRANGRGTRRPQK